MAAILLATVAFCACSGDDTTPAASPTPTSTATPAGPRAPTNLSVSGRIPDLRTPVPPGEGEAGRITLAWTDNSSDETGFRVYQDCSGAISPLLDLPADTTQYGPLQSCRPGRVGVAAFNAAGTSAIAWSP